MTTQKVFVSYEEILDLKTSQHHVTAVGVHTPTGTTPHKLFPGFWRQYQRVKYLGASLSLVPAARLPADISQVGFEGGQAPIDMRDLLNPILWHGCHGESMGSVLNMFMSGGITNNDEVRNLFATPTVDVYGTQSFEASNAAFGDIFEDLYYKALTDNTWAKAHPQRGFRKSGLRPLIYSVGINRQVMPVDGNTTIGPRTSDYDNLETIYDDPVITNTLSGSMGINSPNAAGTTSYYSNIQVNNPVDGFDFTTGSSGTINYTPYYNANNTVFVANRLRSLGWLDTMNRNSGQGNPVVGVGPTHQVLSMGHRVIDENSYSQIPYLMMGIILLPPSYIAEQFFRLVIKHRFSFCKYRGFSMTNTDVLDSNRTTFNAIDALDDWGDENKKGADIDDAEFGSEKSDSETEDLSEL